MKDDLIEKVARAMCIEQEGDSDSPLIEWRTNEDGVIYAYLPLKPRPLWKSYVSYAEPAIRVVLEEAERIAEIYEYDEIEDDGGAVIKPSAAIRALGEET
jgi:hypothetical protein